MTSLSELVIQSEVKSEREKQILFINMHMKSRKIILMNLFVGQE